MAITEPIISLTSTPDSPVGAYLELKSAAAAHSICKCKVAQQPLVNQSSGRTYRLSTLLLRLRRICGAIGCIVAELAPSQFARRDVLVPGLVLMPCLNNPDVEVHAREPVQRTAYRLAQCKQTKTLKGDLGARHCDQGRCWANEMFCQVSYCL